jgi:hypothetical protein
MQYRLRESRRLCVGRRMNETLSKPSGVRDTATGTVIDCLIAIIPLLLPLPGQQWKRLPVTHGKWTFGGCRAESHVRLISRCVGSDLDSWKAA